MTKWNSAVVFAYGEVGYVCLETLFSMGCEVLAVFTHEDDPNETIWYQFGSAAGLCHGADGRKRRRKIHDDEVPVRNLSEG